MVKTSPVKSADCAADLLASAKAQSAFSELERAHKAIRRYTQSTHPIDMATALRAADDHTARALLLIRSI